MPYFVDRVGLVRLVWCTLEFLCIVYMYVGLGLRIILGCVSPADVIFQCVCVCVCVCSVTSLADAEAIGHCARSADRKSTDVGDRKRLRQTDASIGDGYPAAAPPATVPPRAPSLNPRQPHCTHAGRRAVCHSLKSILCRPQADPTYSRCCVPP